MKKKSSKKSSKKSFVKTKRFFKNFYKKIVKINSFFKKHFIISSLILTIGLVLILVWIFKNLWSDIFNCYYLIVTKLHAPKELAQGVDLAFFKINGLAYYFDGMLETIRTVTITIIIFFIGFISFIVNFIVKKFKLIIKLITFNKEEWRRFLLEYRTFSLIFISLTILFLILIFI